MDRPRDQTGESQMTAAKTFVFLLTFWTADGQPPRVEVADHGLTGADCIQRMLDHTGPGTPSCEFDAGE